MDDFNLNMDEDGVGQCMSCDSPVFLTMFDPDAKDYVTLIAIKCANCGLVYRPHHANN